jgi:hypothetical protein
VQNQPAHAPQQRVKFDSDHGACRGDQLFAVLWLGESLSVTVWLGGALIVLAALWTTLRRN